MSMVVYIFIFKIKISIKLSKQKKVNSAIWKKKVDYHVSKTELKNKYWNNSNCSPFKSILSNFAL
jgi:hypothetical protein